MAATQTIFLEPGTQAPDFLLPDAVSGNFYSLEELKGKKGTLILFICNHCPYVLHILNDFVSKAHLIQEKGISIVAISSNDIENYPQDSPSYMKDLAIQKKFSFPYLYDAEQSVAKAYKAACTPDFFLFDANLKSYYRGRYDQSNHKNNEKPHGSDLLQAIDRMLEGKEPDPENKPSLGCNIKWKNNLFPY